MFSLGRDGDLKPTKSLKIKDLDENRTNILYMFPWIEVILLIVAISLHFYFSPIFWELCGNQDINRKADGTYCYYVLVSKEDSFDKFYQLPAKIEKTYDDKDSDGNSDIYYSISNVYWPNGGFLYFEDPIDCDIDQATSGIDQEGRHWHMILTNNKATHKKIQETSSLTPFGIFWFCFWIIIPLIVFVVWFLYYYINWKEIKRRINFKHKMKLMTIESYQTIRRLAEESNMTMEDYLKLCNHILDLTSK